MHNHHPMHPCCQARRPRAGLIDVLGGVFTLTTATLQGGATLITSLVNRVMWGDGAGGDCHCGCRSGRFESPVCRVGCRPRTYRCPHDC